jgi:uncharacterized membrane protein YedE/YeeE
MRSTLESTLPWWIAGPVLGLVIVTLLGLAGKRFGVLGGVTDLVQGSSEGRGLHSWRTLLLLGIVLGSVGYSLLAGAPDAGTAYSWLDAHLTLGGEVGLLFAAGLVIGVGARTAGGCTSGHGLTGAALLSPASLVSIMTIMATAIATTFVVEAAV